MGTKKPRSLTTSGFFGVASIKDAQYGCGGGIPLPSPVAWSLRVAIIDCAFNSLLCGVSLRKKSPPDVDLLALPSRMVVARCNHRLRLQLPALWGIASEKEPTGCGFVGPPQSHGRCALQS